MGVGGVHLSCPKVRGFLPFMNQYSPSAQNTVALTACRRGTVETKWLARALSSVLPDSQWEGWARLGEENAQALSCVSLGCAPASRPALSRSRPPR